MFATCGLPMQTSRIYPLGLYGVYQKRCAMLAYHGRFISLPVALLRRVPCPRPCMSSAFIICFTGLSC
jgi:hypothetical protein